MATTQSPLPPSGDPAPSGQATGVLVYWLLDTREMWPGSKITSAPGAPHCLSLLTAAEQKTVTAKMFIADAKMSLGSALLKRLFISKSLAISWKDIRIGRRDDPVHGKPCAVDEAGVPIPGIDFNVSHQAGLVTLIGWTSRNGVSSGHHDSTNVTVGADIVCVDERGSATRTIDDEGFEAWIDIYDSVFSDEERRTMKFDVDTVTLDDATILTGKEIMPYNRCVKKGQDIELTTAQGRFHRFTSNLIVGAKLRRFYAYFCYKEAYIKLSGEALLAPWLRELEFGRVRPPPPTSHGTLGEIVGDVEVRLRDEIVENVKMKLQAFEDKFMLAGAIQGDTLQDLNVPVITRLDLDRDILPFTS